jgi:hypothetical protein
VNFFQGASIFTMHLKCFEIGFFSNEGHPIMLPNFCVIIPNTIYFAIKFEYGISFFP